MMTARTSTFKENLAGLSMLVFLRFTDLTAAIPLRWRYGITDALSVGACALFYRKRQVVRSNLKCIFGRNPSLFEVVRVFMEYGRYWAESADPSGFWKSSRVMETGPDFPPAEPQFLGLTFHLGNFEIFGQAFYPYLKDDFVVIAERLKPKALADYFCTRRAASHFATIAHDNPQEIVRKLAGGAALGIVCDRSLNGKGVETRLFNKRIRLPLTLVDYSLRHKVPIYVAYCVKEDLGLRLFCRRLDSSLGFDNVVSMIAAILEDAIRRYPFQWHMMSAL
jgi:lauroyl/myristoyl acyltransferase